MLKRGFEGVEGGEGEDFRTGGNGGFVIVGVVYLTVFDFDGMDVRISWKLDTLMGKRWIRFFDIFVCLEK